MSEFKKPTSYRQFLANLFDSRFYAKENLQEVFDEQGTSKQKLYVDITTILLIVLFVLLFVMETYAISQHEREFVLVAEIILMWFFTLEVFLRMRAQGVSKYFKSTFNVIDIVFLIPFWLSLISPVFWAFKLLRGFRLFLIFRYFETYFNKKYAEREFATRVLIGKVAFDFLTLLFISSGLLWAFEHNINPSLNHFHDAVYFMAVNMVTLGSADIFAMTDIGRFIIVATVFVGIFSVPMYMSLMLKNAIRNVHKKRDVCGQCKYEYHDQNANFCKMCGYSLDAPAKRVPKPKKVVDLVAK